MSFQSKPFYLILKWDCLHCTEIPVSCMHIGFFKIKKLKIKSHLLFILVITVCLMTMSCEIFFAANYKISIRKPFLRHKPILNLHVNIF